MQIKHGKWGVRKHRVQICSEQWDNITWDTGDQPQRQSVLGNKRGIGGRNGAITKSVTLKNGIEGRRLAKGYV